MTWLARMFGSSPSLGREPTVPPVGFEAVSEVVLPAAHAIATRDSLREAGLRGHEGLVVWSGVLDGARFHVRTVVTPRQRGIRTADGVCVVIDGDGLHRLNVDTFRRGEALLAQVHSHPERAYHSPMDDQYAVVTTPGSLSLVVPDFAVRPFDVDECAVYRLSRDGRWVEVGRRAAAALITLSTGDKL